jgi:hypothetical protein
VERKCLNLKMSRNGKSLAVAIDANMLFLYAAGPEKDFKSESIMVIKEEQLGGKSVKCMAFSRD